MDFGISNVFLSLLPVLSNVEPFLDYPKIFPTEMCHGGANSCIPVSRNSSKTNGFRVERVRLVSHEVRGSSLEGYLEFNWRGEGQRIFAGRGPLILLCAMGSADPRWKGGVCNTVSNGVRGSSFGR